IDSEYNLRYVDPQWAKIYGPYAGKKCYEYFASRVEACEGCGIRKALEEKIPVVSEEILVKEGNRPIQVTTLPFQDENGEWLVAEVNVDISERKKAEEAVKNAYAQLKDTQDQLLQASKMAAIGQLAGGVAHEINNPLTGVLNNVQLIKLIAQQKKEFNMDDFKVLLDAIEESSLRCTKITKSLLEFSRASKENRQAVNLNETIQKVTGLIEHEMKLNNIGICQELDPALPAVNADIQLVQQVIFDIISNAAWAIHSRKDVQGGTITLKTEYDSWNRNVYLIISDTGIGIEKKSLERIFDPFFTTKPVGQGTGLGLAIVYNIIKDHKGTVEVQSELGQGTRFKITLPAVTSSTA
ncbi:MAG: ATP-binding protein, partial [Candidatus Omnitrophota bacterium]